MEKAVLKDIGTLVKFLYEKNLLKLINKPFIHLIGDNFIRFFTKQIIAGLETLERSELIHFDIKPENLLITSGLILKISDFSFLKIVKQGDEKFKIPGGTHSYVSPEYYNRAKIDGITASYTKESDNQIKMVMKIEYDKLDPDQIKETLGDLYNEEDYYSERDYTIEEFRNKFLEEYECE